MISHLIRNWQKQFGLQFSTLTVLVATFSVVIGILSMQMNLNNLLTLWGDSMQMSVYLEEGLKDNQIENIGEQIKKESFIGKVDFISESKALEIFKDQLSSYAPDLLSDPELAKVVPASFQIGLSKDVPVTNQLTVFTNLSSVVSKIPGVVEVNYGQDWVKNYANLTSSLQTLAILIAGIIVLSSIFVISNSIQSSIHQRRNEIEVLELIGATAYQIRKPYLFEGAFLGGLAYLLAVGLSFLLFMGVKGLMSSYLSFLQIAEHITFADKGLLITLFFSSVLLGALASYLSVRRLNTGWAASRWVKAQ